jgi:hypothetical protein
MFTTAKLRTRWWAAALAGLFLLAACTAEKPKHKERPPAATEERSAAVAASEPTGTPERTAEAQHSERRYEIVTLLPPDAIRAIDDPAFYDVIGADLEYDPGEMVLGVELNGEAKAYPIGLLAQVEIVNDTVGGHPIAVTY